MRRVDSELPLIAKDPTIQGFAFIFGVQVSTDVKSVRHTVNKSEASHCSTLVILWWMVWGAPLQTGASNADRQQST